MAFLITACSLQDRRVDRENRMYKARRTVKHWAERPSVTWVPFALAWAIAACGSNGDAAATGAPGGAGGAGGSIEGGQRDAGGASEDACPHFVGDAGAQMDAATMFDVVPADRSSHPVLDAPDDATCQLPTPASQQRVRSALGVPTTHVILRRRSADAAQRRTNPPLQRASAPTRSCSSPATPHRRRSL